MRSFVGNDLIDLAADHNRGRARRRRLTERVLSPAERERMARGSAGDHGFALLWSAKEAAYKAVVKWVPGLVFAPRLWQVEVDSLTPLREERAGVVVVAGTPVTVRWQPGNGWLHCVALLGAPPALLDQAVAKSTPTAAHDDFGPAETRGFTCPESAAVRTLAKRLLLRHGVDEIEIRRAPSRAGLQPPKIYRHDAPVAGLDLSLSHDGRFVATAVVADKEACPTE